MTKKPKLPKENQWELRKGLHDDIIRDINTYVMANTDVATAYLAEHYLSKFVGEGTTSAEHRRSEAIKKWRRMEGRNRCTNQRLFWSDITAIAGVYMPGMIAEAQRLVALVLGPLQEELIAPLCEFTNGASTRVKRSPRAAALKYMGKAHVTPEAYVVFQRWGAAEGLWGDLNHEIGSPCFVDGSVLFTVPKNTEIDRVACKEPEINMFLQRGVGNYIRRALRKVARIDLNDQTRNQRLAKTGSFSGELATLDLSSASDLISRTLVNILLPVEWYCLLDSIRVKKTYVDEEGVELEMFSSMGNGFTFELESLLFWALSKAIVRGLGFRGTVSVYGDDIIVPTGAAAAFGPIFAYLGFIVNPKKSFWKGPVRESCGKHYHRGTDVTPFFIRKPIEGQTDLILFLNNWRAWACRSSFFGDDDAYALWVKYARHVDARFHGGKDVQEISSLVSPSLPRFALSPKSVTVKNPQEGAYVRWHHIRSQVPSLDSFHILDFALRQSTGGWVSRLSLPYEALVTSESSKQGGFVVRRNKQDRDMGIPLFLAEFREESVKK